MRVKTSVLAILLACSLFVAAACAQPVDTLPEYSTKLYLTAVVDSRTQPSPSSAALLQFMRTNPVMQTLANETVYHEWDNDTSFVRNSSWKQILGSTRPAILLLGVPKDNGTSDIIFYRAGNHLHIQQLPADIQQSIQRYKDYLSTPANRRGSWQRQPCGPQGCPQLETPMEVAPLEIDSPAQPSIHESPPSLERFKIDFPNLDLFFSEPKDPPELTDPNESTIVAPWVLGLSSFLGGGGLLAGLTGIRRLFQRRTLLKDQRRGALQLALWARENGLPVLVDLLEDVTLGDAANLAQRVASLVAAVQSGQGEQALTALLETQLRKRLQTERGRESILAIVEDALGIKIDRQVFATVTKELTQK